MIEYRTKQEGDFSDALPASESDSSESHPTRASTAHGPPHQERAATGQARSHHLRGSPGDQQHSDCSPVAGRLLNGATLAGSLGRSPGAGSERSNNMQSKKILSRHS